MTPREFVVPKVTEMLVTRGAPQAPQAPQAPSLHQRSLVAASLLARP